MEKPVKGDVVIVPFPFSDLSASKKRPALVIASLTGNDIILCQITSKKKFDGYSISLSDADFEKGKLNVPSRIRPNRMFTAEESIVLYKAGSLRQGKINEVEEALVRIIRS
ncbi:type II toxin-antitoxin system PemK/MazF family toxin [Candidatus Woesearchaeota archaeon]|nr:type II toxin-antitoxin system PemK/MazF family toxin [Candidatus Woesearchaeota archaeon]